MNTGTRSSSCLSRLGCGATLLLAALNCVGYLLNIFLIPHPEGVSYWPFWGNLTLLCLIIPGALLGLLVFFLSYRRRNQEAGQEAETAYKSLLVSMETQSTEDATVVELPVIKVEDEE